MISIVVPAHNAERFLALTLDSILAQTIDDWECVVVDDGSVDDTMGVAEGYASCDQRIRAVRQHGMGVSSARNNGFRRISQASQFVTFMDSDDVYLPNALEVLRRSLCADTVAIGSHGLGEFIDVDGTVLCPGAYPDRGRNRLALNGRRLRTLPSDRPTDFTVLINGNVLFPPGLVLTHRWAYDRVGPFDEFFRGAEDWDMLIRLSRLGHFHFVDQVVLHYRRHDANAGAAAGIEQQAWLVRCKGFDSAENSAAQQIVARRGWRAYQLLMIERRIKAMREAAAARRMSALAENLARVPVHALRYLRGRPKPRFVRPPLSWDSQQSGSDSKAEEAHEL